MIEDNQKITDFINSSYILANGVIPESATFVINTRTSLDKPIEAPDWV